LSLRERWSGSHGTICVPRVFSGWAKNKPTA
jgi:hypothetical protein